MEWIDERAENILRSLFYQVQHTQVVVDGIFYGTAGEEVDISIFHFNG